MDTPCIWFQKMNNCDIRGRPMTDLVNLILLIPVLVMIVLIVVILFK